LALLINPDYDRNTNHTDKHSYLDWQKRAHLVQTVHTFENPDDERVGLKGEVMEFAVKEVLNVGFYNPGDEEGGARSLCLVVSAAGPVHLPQDQQTPDVHVLVKLVGPPGSGKLWMYHSGRKKTKENEEAWPAIRTLMAEFASQTFSKSVALKQRKSKQPYTFPKYVTSIKRSCSLAYLLIKVLTGNPNHRMGSLAKYARSLQDRIIDTCLDDNYHAHGEEQDEDLDEDEDSAAGVDPWKAVPQAASSSSGYY
jgi:hypothetical protein